MLWEHYRPVPVKWIIGKLCKCLMQQLNVLPEMYFLKRKSEINLPTKGLLSFPPPFWI